jgi:hypothetical protein
VVRTQQRHSDSLLKRIRGSNLQKDCYEQLALTVEQFWKGLPEYLDGFYRRSNFQHGEIRPGKTAEK